MLKKTALLVDVGFPYHKHQQHQYLTFTIICEGDISCTGRSTDRTVNFWAMLPTNVISFWRANWKKRYAFTVSISVTVLNFVISFVTYFYKTRKYQQYTGVLWAPFSAVFLVAGSFNMVRSEASNIFSIVHRKFQKTVYNAKYSGHNLSRVVTCES